MAVSEIPEIGRNWWLFLVVGLVSIIAGILAIVYPDITLLALGIIVGVGLLFSGGIEIAEAIAGDHESRVLAAIVGVLSIVAGLICLRRPGRACSRSWSCSASISWSPASCASSARSRRSRTAPQMGLGIIDVILGILILSLPELSLVTLAILFAISLLIRGAWRGGSRSSCAAPGTWSQRYRPRAVPERTAAGARRRIRHGLGRVLSRGRRRCGASGSRASGSTSGR